MQLNEKRKEIDDIDRQIAEMLARRAAISREISMLKASAGLPVQDSQREADVIRRAIEVAGSEREVDAIRNIYRTIIAESRRIQTDAIADVMANGVI